MRAGVVVLTIIVVVVSVSFLYMADEAISDGSCNIAVLPIEGVVLPYYGLADFAMVTTPEAVDNFMKQAEADTDIDGVLVEINSPGGTPVASERIAERFRNSDLPVVGMIGDVGASGGYMIAAATDYLLASPMSDVGSIGVNMSYLEESEKNDEEGIEYVQLTTGKFKDIGSPNRPITEEERELLQADLELVHNHFVGLVSEYRDLPVSQVIRLADGASMPGVRALENNLIDQLGGRSEAGQFFATLLETGVSNIGFCDYEKPMISF